MGSPIFEEKIAELTPVLTFIKRTGGFNNLPLQVHIATIVVGAELSRPCLLGVVYLREGHAPQSKQRAYFEASRRQSGEEADETGFEAREIEKGEGDDRIDGGACTHSACFSPALVLGV